MGYLSPAEKEEARKDLKVLFGVFIFLFGVIVMGALVLSLMFKSA